MVGLVIRIATKLGIHRDGSAFNLLPYQIEIRRRLWWQICILDVRTAEDNGTDPAIYEHSFNTKFPLNVNDIDIDRGMSDGPKESTSRTEMLFSLQRFEISYAIRKIVFSDKFTRDNGYSIMSTAQKGHFVEELSTTIEERYIRNCDMKIPLCFITATAGKLVLAKLKLIIHHTARKRGEQGLQDIDKTLFTTSVEILEYSHALRTNENYQRWAWLFQTYIEWDALAYLLLRLSNSQNGSYIARAWRAVSTAFADWKSDNLLEVHERRWRRIEELKARALAAHSNGPIPGQQSIDQTIALAVPPVTLSSVDQGIVVPNLYIESTMHQTRTRQMVENRASDWAPQTKLLKQGLLDGFRRESQSQGEDVATLPARASDFFDGHTNINTFIGRSSVPFQDQGSTDPSDLADTIDWNFNMLGSEMHEGFSWDMEVDGGLNFCL
jgi:hypothetical protein